MNLLRTLLYIAAFLPDILHCQARTAAELFIAAPNEAMMMFDRNLRMDMLDYYRAGLDRKVSLFDTPDGAKITALDDNSITISIGDNSKIQFAVIPQAGLVRDTTVVIIETTATPVPDSSIFYYRPGKDQDIVRPVDGAPTVKDFLAKADRKSKDLPPFLLATAEYLPDKKRFVFTNTTAQYYLDSVRPQIVENMAKTLTFRMHPYGILEPESNIFTKQVGGRR